MAKKLLLLGAGIEQVNAINIAKELGLYIITADQNPKSPGFRLADKSYCIDINDTKRILEIARLHDIDGIMTHAVEIPQVVATVANELSLPGISPESAENATNKLQRIKCFERHGVPHPIYAVAENLDDARNKAQSIGFPVVFKPVDNRGSRGVVQANSLDEVDLAYNEAVSHTRVKNQILIEEFLAGIELSTESVIHNGKIFTPCLADRNYGDKKRFYPYMIEDGGQLPTSLPSKMQKHVETVIDKAVKALGLDFGVAKGDILIHNNVPYVIEMAARTSGGRFCDEKVPLSNGVNILRPLIKMHVGDNVDIDEFMPKHQKGVAERTIIAHPGIITHISGISNVKKFPWVHRIHINPDVKIGYRVSKMKNNTDKIGYIIALGDTQEIAVKRAEQAVQMIRINTEEESTHLYGISNEIL